jgi:NADPH-dependent curcumin reductase CurA
MEAAMSDTVNRQIVLKNRPAASPSPSDFALVETPMPQPGAGEVLTRTLYLSLDPYMRGRMNDAKSYASPAQLGEPMVGGTVGKVLSSKHPGFAPGDLVLGAAGWQTHAVAEGKALRKLDPALQHPSYALGILGMPGMTAYCGLLDIGKPQPGETVVVSAAAGAVGQIVGQLAKLKGCRAIGIAGGEAKCRYLVEELGFDAALDHRAPDLRRSLAAACPKGIDVYFENVGGAVQRAVWPLLNTFARVPLCGLVAQYNTGTSTPGPDMLSVVFKRLLLRGFIVLDFADREADFQRDMSAWLREGRFKYREDVVEGIENAPGAFIGMLEGRNFGKALVKVG